eukprot:403371398
MAMSQQQAYLEDSQYEVRVAGGRFKMGKKIGSGSFGEIFLAVDMQTGKDCAIKFVNNFQKQLRFHLGVKKIGFPQFLYFGPEGDYFIMAIELLGPSLEDLFVYCGRKLSLKTVLLIAEQLIHKIEVFQTRGFIHRDLKPENILIGLEENAQTLYLIDFGLAKRWKNPQTNEHIPFRDKKSLTGTARYASANTHLGIEQSRRDDLEGAGYVLLYLLKGELPWQGLRARNKDDKYRKIKDCKVTTPIEKLCHGLPEEFAIFMSYCRQLKFDETPNYAFIRRNFKELYYKCGFEHEFIFDWTIQRYRVDKPSTYSNENDDKKSGYHESMKNQGTSLDDQVDQTNQLAIEKAQDQIELEDDQNIKDHDDVLMNIPGMEDIVDGNGNRIVRPGGNNIEQQVLEGDYRQGQEGGRNGKKDKKKNGKNKKDKKAGDKDKKCIVF